MSGLITYKIVEDQDDRIKKTAKIACNFWNHFVTPKSTIIIRLGLFTASGTTIARAYEPFKYLGIVYGVVEFNTVFLARYSDYEIAGTIIHEIGHTLGFGWSEWMGLFDKSSGKFKPDSIEKRRDLENMLVESDYGPGTRYSHWDEERFDKELMTGFKDKAEHVLPVTIGIMKLLGHRVDEELPEKTSLELLMKMYENVMFSRKDTVEKLDLDHYEKTEIWEEVYSKNKVEKTV